jgi:hypothetical protein
MTLNGEKKRGKLWWLSLFINFISQFKAKSVINKKHVNV